MKIKLTTNAHVTLPEHIKNVDISYGFAFYGKHFDTKTEKESFSIKLLAKLDNLLNKKLNLSSSDKTSIDAIAESVNYINKTASIESLKDMKVQINTSSKFNSAYKSLLSSVGAKDESIERLSDSVAHIFSHKKLIVLGTKLLSNFLNIGSTANEIKKASEFVLFHEFSHSLEKTNVMQYGSILPKSFDILISKIDNLKYGYDSLLNEHIQKEHKESPYELFKKEIGNITTVKGEIYADISAILMIRNYEIDKGTYNKEEHLKFIEQLIDVRNQEYADNKIEKDKNIKLLKPIEDLTTSELQEIKKEKENNQSTNILNSIGHLTSSALEELKKDINNYNSSYIFSEKEIHHMTEAKVLEGTSRIIYSIIQSCNEVVPQLNSIVSMTYNQETGIPEIEKEQKENKYLLFKKEIEKNCGDAWIDEFKNKVEEAKKSNMYSLKSAIFTIGAARKFFDRNFKENLEINDLLDYIPNPLIEKTEKKSGNIMMHGNIENKEIININLIRQDLDLITVNNSTQTTNDIKNNLLKIRKKFQNTSKNNDNELKI